MSPERKLKLSVALLLNLLAIGSIGYQYLEGWSLFDSFYMTLITITTIGYGEIHSLSFSGRLFTSFLIVLGVGTMGYALGSFNQMALEGQLNQYLRTRKRKKQMDQLSNHYIICGFGRVGMKVAREIRLKNEEVVILESNEDAVDLAIKEGYYVIQEDASTEEALMKAGILRAKTLISSIPSDASNVFITLSAKELFPQIFVVVRMEDSRSKKKLLRAGADRVVAPYEMGGEKMALLALSPNFVEFMDILNPSGGGTGYRIEELLVKSKSAISQKSILQSNIRSQTGVIIIGIKKSDGSLLFNPKPDIIIEGGDILIAVGNKKQLETLSQMAQ